MVVQNNCSKNLQSSRRVHVRSLLNVAVMSYIQGSCKHNYNIEMMVIINPIMTESKTNVNETLPFVINSIHTVSLQLLSVSR